MIKWLNGFRFLSSRKIEKKMVRNIFQYNIIKSLQILRNHHIFTKNNNGHKICL